MLFGDSDILISPARSMSQFTKEEFHETYLSAKPSQKSEDTRFPQAYEHSGWTESNRRSASARPKTPGRLIFAGKQDYKAD